MDDRKPLPIHQVLAELEAKYAAGAAVIATANGKLDGLALGEWLHGGDVRDALGIESAYASEGLTDALTIFEQLSRRPTSAVPRTRVELPGRQLQLGREGPDATLAADAATFVRLLGGRAPDPGRYRLTGADANRYVVFR